MTFLGTISGILIQIFLTKATEFLILVVFLGMYKLWEIVCMQQI